MGNRRRLDLLWKCLEDAKLQLDFTHNRPAQDSGSGLVQAVRARELAAKNYLRVLGDLKAADQEGDGESEPEPSATPEGLNGITPREREVLVLIASGKSSKQIAAHLGIAFRTVVCHRYRIQSKLKVHNTADLTRAAIRMGLIEL